MRPSDFVGVSDFVGTDVRCIAVDSAVGRDACAACAVIARSGVESAACTRDESGPRTSDPVRSGRAGRGHAVMTHDCHCAMHCVACRTATARQRVFNHKVRRTAPRRAGPAGPPPGRWRCPARGATQRQRPTGTGHDETGHVRGRRPPRARRTDLDASNLRLLDIYTIKHTT